MSDKDPDLDAVLRKLADVLEKDKEIHIFDRDEVSVLRDIISAYQMFLSWGKLGKFLIWVLITAAAVLTAASTLGFPWGAK